jgi:hypothetical protein
VKSLARDGVPAGKHMAAHFGRSTGRKTRGGEEQDQRNKVRRRAARGSGKKNCSAEGKVATAAERFKKQKSMEP